MPRFDKKTKDTIVDLIRRGTKSCLPNGANIEQACLYHAYATQQILQAVLTNGLGPHSKCIMQAGSASWMMIKPEEDDGKINTHFSYVWEGDAHTQLIKMSMIENYMPEMHAWNAILSPGEPPQLVDVSTKYLKEQCKRLGMDWTAKDPPEYIWGGAFELRTESIIYNPSEEATKFAYAVLGQEIDKFKHLKPY